MVISGVLYTECTFQPCWFPFGYLSPRLDCVFRESRDRVLFTTGYRASSKVADIIALIGAHLTLSERVTN